MRSSSSRGPAKRGLLALFVALVLVAGCEARSPVDEADPQGTLTTRIPQDLTLDPQLATFTYDVGAILMVYEPLLRFEPKTYGPVPAAAKALPEISADGLTYKFAIRDDAKYSDGTTVRARDYAYGISRLCDPAIKPFYAIVAYAIQGCAAWSRMDPAKDSPDALSQARTTLFNTGLRVTNEHDLTITLTQPAAWFASIAALWFFVPVREADVIHGGDDWAEPSTYVGNGPFVLTAWKHGERLVFAPNRYFREPPKLKQWTKVIIQEPAVALDAYRHDEIEAFAFGVRAADTIVTDIRTDAALNGQFRVLTDPCTFAVTFNSRRPPFDDPLVRLAFAKAIDRESYVREFTGGVGRPALSLIAPGLPGHDPDDTFQRYDPQEARRLLASSRYAGTDALRSIAFPVKLQPALPRLGAEWLRDHWRSELGVQINVELTDGPTYSQLFRKGETVPSLYIPGWCADYPDQQDWLSVLFHSGSSNNWAYLAGSADAGFDRLLDEADRERDPARRNDLYRTASRTISERAVVAFLNYGGSIALRKPWVRGVVEDALFEELGATSAEKIFIAKKGR